MEMNKNDAIPVKSSKIGFDLKLIPLLFLEGTTRNNDRCIVWVDGFGWFHHALHAGTQNGGGIFTFFKAIFG